MSHPTTLLHNLGLFRNKSGAFFKDMNDNHQRVLRSHAHTLTRTHAFSRSHAHTLTRSHVRTLTRSHAHTFTRSQPFTCSHGSRLHVHTRSHGSHFHTFARLCECAHVISSVYSLRDISHRTFTRNMVNKNSTRTRCCLAVPHSPAVFSHLPAALLPPSNQSFSFLFVFLLSRLQ